MGAQRLLKQRISGLIFRLTSNNFASGRPVSVFALTAAVVSLLPFHFSPPDRPAAPAAQTAPGGAVAFVSAHLATVPGSVTVHSGDTLSALSKTACGTAADWSGLYKANSKTLTGGPDMIEPGQRLKVSCSDPGYTYPAPPAPAPAAPAQQQPVEAAVQSSVGVTTGHSNQSAPAVGSYSGAGGMQSCIIRAESGGNPNIWNASGHWGLYQFSESTWVAHGGSAASFGNASVAEQNAVFAQTVADDGYSDWTPYDGC
jgi:LysM repeat protein